MRCAACLLAQGFLWLRDCYRGQVDTVYRPRFMLDPRVIRIPIIPGSDPRQMYGDVAARGVKGVVLEAFGVGNMPDRDAGWLPWLRDQRKKGVLVYLSSQCTAGPLHPELCASVWHAPPNTSDAGSQQLRAQTDFPSPLVQTSRDLLH